MQASQGYQPEQGITRYNKTRYKPSCIRPEWQPSKRKRVSRADKGVRNTPIPLLGVPQKHQPNKNNIFAEDLVQTQADSITATSVSVNPYETCLIDSVCCVLLVSCPLWLLQSFFPFFCGIPRCF